jgi:antitoxin (DNA-binding transcriptional repressor) of toxin-antitoxin stability system
MSLQQAAPRTERKEPPVSTTTLDRPLPDDTMSHACYVSSMARELTQRELRNKSGEVMQALDRGESFVVTRNGVPVGELAPLGRRRLVSAEGLLDAFARVPAVDAEQLRADLDALASQDADPRA